MKHFYWMVFGNAVVLCALVAVCFWQTSKTERTQRTWHEVSEVGTMHITDSEIILFCKINKDDLTTEEYKKILKGNLR